MPINLSKVCLKCFCDSVKNTINHDGIEHAGYLSYLTILSIFPSILWFTALASYLNIFIDYHESIERFFNGLVSKIPYDTISALMPRIKEIISGPPTNLLTIAAIGMLWTASSVIEGFRTIFNRAYHVQSTPNYIVKRIMSILQFLLIAALLSFLVFIIKILPIKEINPHNALYHLKSISNPLILFLYVSLLYFILPNVKHTWISIIPGACATVTLWIISSKLFVGYLKTFHQLNLVYGSLASVVISMIFFYIINLILIYGAELNHSVSTAYKKKITLVQSI